MLNLLLRHFLIFWVLIILFSAGPLYAAAQEKPPAPAEQVTAPSTSPDTLPRVLGAEAAFLVKEVSGLKSRVIEARKALKNAEDDLQEITGNLAAFKASLALKTLPLTQVPEADNTFALQQEKLHRRLKEINELAVIFKKEQAAKEAAQAALQAEVNTLKASGHPVVRSPQMQNAYEKYQQAMAAQKQQAALLLQSLQKTVSLLDQEKKLIADTQAELKKYMDEQWKAGLLQRQEGLSFWEQVGWLWQNLANLPARLQHWLLKMIASGQWRSLLKAHLARLLGLVIFILFISWGALRLSRRYAPDFRKWQAQAATLSAKGFLSLGHILTTHLLPLSWLLTLWLAFRILGLPEGHAVGLLFYLLITLMALRLGCLWIQAAFAGPTAGGFLPLAAGTARFYRRSLKLFLAFMLLGNLALSGADYLGFPPDSRIFLEHLFRVGFLCWLLWLLRPYYLTDLLEKLPSPPWLRRPGISRLVRQLLWLMLVTIIVAALLGFHYLAFYVAYAAALTWIIVIFLGLLWLGVGKLLDHLLHPETGWARRRYPDHEELLKKFHVQTRRLLTAILALIALLEGLKAWEVDLGRFAWVYEWVTWGPKVGTVQLTPLHIGSAVLAMYLTYWFSRLSRYLMRERVYPHTGWDRGIQYTISTTLHYVILIIGVLLALNLLGFPLTNLALVFGALGVGIGFGLQNIVNNFISGLILLFERPVKVGDILVVDGQWGKVKEIRVRSTIFETVDRYVLIIPNSEMLSGKIVNWTHYGRGPTRLNLEVGVGYGSDAALVTRLLLEVCRANKLVLAEPPPIVFFRAYGDSALNFTLRVYLPSPDPAQRTQATHELNSAIFETFKEHGIEIPFPQRDLYIKNWPKGLAGEEEV